MKASVMQPLTRRQTILGAGAAAGCSATQGLSMEPSFFIPPEEAAHQATFMQWPNNRRVYRDVYFLQDTHRVIVDIANMISQFEHVILLAASEHHTKIRPRLSKDVELWDIPTDDLWARDAGPLFQNNSSGAQRIASMNFNGWGNKQVHPADGKIAARVAEALNLPLVDTGLVGEPGGVEFDGHGTLAAHESCWVNDNRNLMSKAEITNRLMDVYGASSMIWSPGVRGQDITDYHIDSLMRFTGNNRGIIQLPDAPTEMWSRAMFDTYDALRNAGVQLDVIPEPRRPRITDPEFVASYANYYVCNGAVLCAEFGDKDADTQAIETLKRHYPGREVIAMNVDPLGELGGGVHCATQQWPA